MKLPRDIDGRQLVKVLAALGYEPVRQSGSHIRIECRTPAPQAVTIPDHSPLMPQPLF